MCNRFTLRTPVHVWARHFNLSAQTEWQIPLRYNVCPQTQIPVIRQVGDERQLAMMKWGLVPSWSLEPKTKYSTLNAKSEEAATKPAYKSAMKSRHCLIPADGFYDWEEIDKKKFPHYYQLRDQPIFAFAGLWERWSKAEPPLETCTILTTRPNELLMKIGHDRSPVILSPNDYSAWLDPTNNDPESLRYLFEPYPADQMTDTPANTYVNKVGNEGPECLIPPL
jgi:putative SOS response-associated peptidase YedK